jgi:uncharacterized membrane protein YqhA
MFKPLLNSSRYLVLAAVLGALASATALFAYGIVDTVVVISRTLVSGDVSGKAAKATTLYFIEIFDLFLLGIAATVALVIAALNHYPWIVKGGQEVVLARAGVVFVPGRSRRAEGWGTIFSMIRTFA